LSAIQVSSVKRHKRFDKCVPARMTYRLAISYTKTTKKTKTENLTSFDLFFPFCSFVFFLFSLLFLDWKSVVKHVVPQTLSPPGSTPWKQQGPPSPSSASSDSSPAYSPSRTLDLSGSSTSFSSDRVKMSTHQWKSGPVEQWNNEQVRSITSRCLQLLIPFPPT
jgi:hypothetical protein